jgi:hypothetical protein
VPTPIYHITHLNNLPLILQHGRLYCNSQRAQLGIQHINIAHQTIQDRRAATRVPLPPGGVLHDYVPFYFAPRSPMLYVIHRGNVEGYTDGQFPILHLVSTAEAVQTDGLPFVFTDGHAIKAYTTFYNALTDLDKVDWQIMRAHYWHDTVEDGDRLRRRNAEFLVHESVPWTMVDEIGVMESEIAEKVTRLLASQAHRPAVALRKDWYYY